MEQRQSQPTIKFYSVQDEYGWLSNFAYYSIRLKGKTWFSTEHYFQAQKFAGTKHEETLRRTKSVPRVAKLGRDRSLPLRRDWGSVKLSIMLEALMAKFTQHPELRKLLTATGDALLIEHTAQDSFWGDGGDGSGQNQLGILLMRAREELRGLRKTVD